MNEHNPHVLPPQRAAGQGACDPAAGAGTGDDAALGREAPASPDEAGPSLTERLPRPPHVIRIGGRTIIMPTSRWVRIGLGGALVLFGFFGFLPILGFWMIPLGLLILSIDFAIVRRWRRRSVVWFQRRFPGLSATLRRWTTPAPLRGGQDRR